MNRLQRWERATSVPLMILAVLFLVVYGVPIIWPEIPKQAHNLAEWASWAIWAAFVVDFLVRLGLANRRREFLRKNWLDIPVIALPLLRPLRLLRLVTLLRFLDRRATSGLRGKVLAYVLGGSALLALVGALAVLEAERDNPGANIHNFGDAAWWAMTTMTTVGYGDTYPTTLTGRVIAVLLMVGGIAILGTVTAALASWLVERVQEATQPESEILDRLTDLQAQVSTPSSSGDEPSAAGNSSPLGPPWYATSHALSSGCRCGGTATRRRPAACLGRPCTPRPRTFAPDLGDGLLNPERGRVVGYVATP